MTGIAGVLNSLAFQMFSYDKGTRFSDGRLLCSRRVGRSEVGVFFWLLSFVREQQSVVLDLGSPVQLLTGTPCASSVTVTSSSCRMRAERMPASSETDVMVQAVMGGAAGHSASRWMK